MKIKNKKITLTQIMYGSIITFLIIFGIVIIAYIYLKLDSFFTNIQEITSEKEVLAVKNETLFHLNSRKFTLEDYSEKTLIIQAVMHPDENFANIKDLFDELKIFKKKYRLSLTDFEGETIYSNYNDFSIDYKSSELVQNLLLDKKKQELSEIEIFKENDTYFWRLVSVVYYNKNIEGALILEMPINEPFIHDSHLSELSNGVSVDLIFKNNIIASFGKIENGLTKTVRLSKDISLTFNFDDSFYQEMRAEIIYEILIILVFISILFIFIQIFFSKIFFIEPIHRLKKMMSNFINGKKVDIIENHQEIFELSELTKDFLFMIESVETREYLLNESNKEITEKNQDLIKALTDVQTIQAKLIQQEKLAGIGQLAAGVAHELNNPIGFVSGNFTALNKYFIIITNFFKFLDKRLSNKDEKDEHSTLTINELKSIIEEYKEENNFEFILSDINDFISINIYQ